MRTLIRSAGYAWILHLVLTAACVWALHVHATYRVLAGPLLKLLPWAGVAVTALSALMLLVSLLPGGGLIARTLDRLDRRSMWLAALLLPTCFAASAYATSPLLGYLFLGFGLTTAAASIVAVTRRVVADGGATLAAGLRWLQGAALVVIGTFLLWSVVVFVNGASDWSVPVEHDSEVVAIVMTVVDTGLGDLVPHAQTELRSWRSPGRLERLVLAPGENSRIWIGQPVRVHVHPGYLRVPWVSALELDEVRHARQILQVSPTAFHAMKQLFTALLQRRQWEEALAVGRLFVQAYPDDVGGIEHIAGLLGVAGRYGDQIELIEPLVARRPEYTTLCMLGFALDRSGNHGRAIEVLKRATRIRPDDFLALHFLGEAYTALGRREEAIAAYEAELVVRPGSAEIRRRIRALRSAIAAR
jgi:Tetratricopeptide repeat